MVAEENLLTQAIAIEPLVSVVVAFLNEEKFLEETVESVIHQTYKNWELLLVDDGSSDTSTALAKKYAEAFTGKIIYCEHAEHANKGLSASRNLGIQKSRGRYVAFLDADDVWLPGKITNQVNIFQQNAGIGMIAEASLYWESWFNARLDDTILEIGAKPDQVYVPPLLSYRLYPLGSGAAPVPSGLMLTRSAIDSVNGFEESFRKKYALYEDQAFLSKIYLSQKVYISSQSNNLYRQRQGSIVKTVKADGQYDNVRQYFLEWFSKYLIDHNNKDQVLAKLLKKALQPYHKPFTYWIAKTLPSSVKAIIKKISA